MRQRSFSQPVRDQLLKPNRFYGKERPGSRRSSVIELSKYGFETLREEEEFVLRRGQRDGDFVCDFGGGSRLRAPMPSNGSTGNTIKRPQVRERVKTRQWREEETMSDIQPAVGDDGEGADVVVRGSAAGFAQEIFAGPRRLSADEPRATGGTDTA